MKVCSRERERERCRCFVAHISLMRCYWRERTALSGTLLQSGCNKQSLLCLQKPLICLLLNVFTSNRLVSFLSTACDVLTGCVSRRTGRGRGAPAYQCERALICTYTPSLHRYRIWGRRWVEVINCSAVFAPTTRHKVIKCSAIREPSYYIFSD